MSKTRLMKTGPPSLQICLGIPSRMKEVLRNIAKAGFRVEYRQRIGRGYTIPFNHVVFWTATSLICINNTQDLHGYLKIAGSCHKNWNFSEVD